MIEKFKLVDVEVDENLGIVEMKKEYIPNDREKRNLEINVLIKQDIFPGQPFEVTVNGEALQNVRPLSDIRQYTTEVDSLPCQVVMELIPDWKRGKVEEKTVAGLGRTSGVFKNIYDQLPIEAHREETINEGDEPELRFKASTLLKLDEDALWVWRRSAIFQEGAILFILAVFALVAVLAVTGSLKFIVAAASIVVLVILGVLMEKHRRNTIKKLLTLKK